LRDFHLSRFAVSSMARSIRLRGKAKFASRLNMFRRFKVAEQNNGLAEIRNDDFHIAIPPHPEGRYGQSSRNVKWVAVDAGGGARRATRACGRQKRVVLASRR
jgi:hypothetical protein